MSRQILARKISLPLLTFYGLGTILGAGIYVLIGEVTLRAGSYAPLSFILAALIAAITAYSFARLSSIFPKSAGEACYVFAAFNRKSLSAIVGLSVILIGTVSAATMIRGFTGYFLAIFPVSELVVIIAVIIVITIISIWGVSESLIIASLITIVEIIGLCFVVFVTIDLSEDINYILPSIDSVFSNTNVIFYAAFISFYAYIGFEDIVNIAEETINPKRVVPMAIALSLLLSTLLYLILSVSCAIFIPSSIFDTSNAPLVAIVEHRGYDPILMAFISMVAILNGALVQLIMASRVLYGMANQKLFVKIFDQINKSTQTPIIATITVAILMSILTLNLQLITLAEITSGITLAIFIIVQASLLYFSIKSNMNNKLDFFLPLTGIILNIALIIFGYSKYFQHFI